MPLFVGWVREQFETQGAWGGDPWAPLSAAYAARKAILYPGRPILYAEGDLRQSASRPERDVSPSELVLSFGWEGRSGRNVGRELDPEWHQIGTDRMPARPIVPDRLPADALFDLELAAEDYLEDSMRRVGLA